MHKATITVLILGGIGLIASIVALTAGAGQFIEDVDEIDPYGEELWAGTTYSSYEGRLDASSMYYVYIQDTRDARVELTASNEMSRFVPCEEDGSCHDVAFDGVQYRYLGYLSIAQTENCEVDFDGDVVGGSDVMIRELALFTDGAVIFSVGCFGSLASCLLLIVGIILVFTLKDKKSQDTQTVLVLPSIADAE